MKPWEETWHAEQVPEYCDDAGAANVLDEDGLLVAEPTQRAGADLAERERAAFDVARFIAAAPDMARVLLAIEARDDETGRRLGCPACPADTPVEPHAPDCALDAALRKAGVR